MLIWGRGQAVRRLEHLARSLRQPRLLVIAESALGRKIEFERLIRLADLALIASPEPPVMATAMCMAAALPIISGVSSASAELLEDGATASLAPTFAPRLIAQRLLQAIENPDVAQKWGRNAQMEATRRFAPAEIVSRFISLYRHAAGISPKRGADEEQCQPALS
jgi:glycosyltransferase involved in cell wall biosynthesis